MANGLFVCNIFLVLACPVLGATRGKTFNVLMVIKQKMLHELCPQGGDGNMTDGLDVTLVVFDNRYFKDLVSLRGFLNSNQTLYCDNARTWRVVEQFARDEEAFFRVFVEGMIKMGELQNIKKGEIRRNCRVANDQRRLMLPFSRFE